MCSARTPNPYLLTHSKVLCLSLPVNHLNEQMEIKSPHWAEKFLFKITLRILHFHLDFVKIPSEDNNNTDRAAARLNTISSHLKPPQRPQHWAFLLVSKPYTHTEQCDTTQKCQTWYLLVFFTLLQGTVLLSPVCNDRTSGGTQATE